MTGIAKAWVNFNGSSAAIRGSFNVSSVTKISTGNYTVTFTTAMPNIDYGITASSSNQGTYGSIICAINSTSTGGNQPRTPTTTTAGITTEQTSIGYIDTSYVCVSVFSS
jgi:N-methylhydantoinase B/oxoprolinase/acetone carboxylase alpha subunit